MTKFNLPVKLIVVDVETNGRGMESKIVEVGAVCLDEELQEIGEFEMLVDGRPMSPEATAVNNITDAMLAGKPLWVECYRKWVAWCDQWKPYVLGTWSDFDTMALRPEYERIGIRYPHPGHAWDIKTVVWYECIKLGYPSRTFPVDRACEILNIPFEGQKHRALPDAKMEAKLFKTVVLRKPAEQMW